MLGEELLKTSGHFHPPTPCALHVSYPEAYEVIHGTVWFLLQKVEKATDIYAPVGKVRITDVILAEVRAGERVIMPPNYGHVMVNPTDGIVVTADWVCDDFSSYYGPYEAHQGAAVYVLPGKTGGDPEVVPNERYGDVPACRRARPRQEIPELGVAPDLALFCAFYAAPEKFRSLRQPHVAGDALAVEQLFDFE